MSAANWITVHFSSKSAVCDFDILSSFLQCGWFFDEQQVCFMPIDGDDYSWSTETANLSVIKSVFCVREKNGKSNGIVLYFSEERVRISVVFYRDQQVFISIDSYVKSIEGTRIADMSWYLERILPAFDDKAGVSNIEINIMP